MTNSVCEVDLREGGAFRIVMQAEDGSQYPWRGRYLEIAEPERLVFTVGACDLPPQWREQLGKSGPQVEGELGVGRISTVTFEDLGDKTELTMQLLFATTKERDQTVRTYGAEAGLKQTIGRLAKYVTQL